MANLDIEKELRSMGLAPKSWPEVLETIKGKLPPPEWERFSRLHKNFIGYRSESTLSRFYGFVFSHGLQTDLNGYRFGRLKTVLEDLLPEIPEGISILDIGAGSGLIASILLRNRSPSALVVQDPCREIRDELTAQGFTVLPHPAPASPSPSSSSPASSPTSSQSDTVQPGGTGFDLLLCVDSLGEINADDDGALAKPGGVPEADLPEMLEERAGFAQKLEPWKAYLAPQGRILVWEPFAYQNAMESLAKLLRDNGWDAKVLSKVPGRNYLELRPK